MENPSNNIFVDGQEVYLKGRGRGYIKMLRDEGFAVHFDDGARLYRPQSSYVLEQLAEDPLAMYEEEIAEDKAIKTKISAIVAERNGQKENPNTLETQNILFDADVFSQERQGVAEGKLSVQPRYEDLGPLDTTLVQELEKLFIESYMDYPDDKEEAIKNMFQFYGIAWPDDIVPINSGSRGGKTKRGGLQIKMWFRIPEDKACFPDGIVTDGDKILLRDTKFALRLLMAGFTISKYPRKKEEKIVWSCKA